MYDDNFLTFGIDKWGVHLDTEPLYLSMTWGTVILAVLVVVGLKTLKKQKNKK